MKNIDRAYLIVNRYLDRAKQDRNKNGYHENLGYELSNKVRDGINKLHLEYSDNAKVMSYFYRQCDAL